MDLDIRTATELVDQTWDATIVPTLVEYIAIPNQSPHFDPDWAAAGHMDRAVALLEGWCRDQPIKGMTSEVVRLPGRTPALLLEIPGQVDDTVLLYGHLDKQPPMTGWDDDLGPWKPVLRDHKLYGRGGADDGYAVFASLTAIRALQEQGVPHARCVVLIEACEESGSFDLPAIIDAVEDRLGEPSLVVCLDSGCGNYEQLWCTTSLRGMGILEVTAEVLTEGVHSGDASGIVPGSFRVLRELLERLEDGASGRLKPEGLHVEIPAERVEQARVAAGQLGEAVWGKFPFVDGVQPMGDDGTARVLARTWRPTLTVVGQAGLPDLKGGAVLRPSTTLKLSLRLPPTADSAQAVADVAALLERNPPHGARVRCKGQESADGWDSPPVAPWLAESLERASQESFGKPVCFMGEGGTIPFMGMLGERFPAAQFVITGVLGPGSNAHGPNEFLHLPMAARLTTCVSRVLADHATRG
jgi:acetylornithine deacetylase/succinyl-diaminopimelate desuccinylase-like protein